MSMYENLDELFEESALKETLNEGRPKKPSAKTGTYKPDLKLVSPENKKRGYKSVIRFLPNFVNNEESIKLYLREKYNGQKLILGNAQINRRNYFIKIESIKDLQGFYDSASNKDPFFLKEDKYLGRDCEIYKLKTQLKESKNAIFVEKNKLITYNNKTTSYVLIIEDEQQPDLVGKVMVFSYGKQIEDKINAEIKGLNVDGVECEPFSLERGKDFQLLITEKEVKQEGTDKTVKMPDYVTSLFRVESTISIPNKDGVLKKVPLNAEGKLSSEMRSKVVDFLLTREVELETFAPKAITPTIAAKIEQVKNYMLGKELDMESINPTYAAVNANPKQATSNDFEMDIASSFDETTTSTTAEASADTEEIDEFEWE